MLNPGLSSEQVRRSLTQPVARCPMCQVKLYTPDIVHRNWAGCACCKVEYAIGTDEVIYCRYEPRGHPHCIHYEDAGASKPTKTGQFLRYLLRRT